MVFGWLENICGDTEECFHLRYLCLCVHAYVNNKENMKLFSMTEKLESISCLRCLAESLSILNHVHMDTPICFKSR